MIALSLLAQALSLLFTDSFTDTIQEGYPVRRILRCHVALNSRYSTPPSSQSCVFSVDTSTLALVNCASATHGRDQAVNAEALGDPHGIDAIDESVTTDHQRAPRCSGRTQVSHCSRLGFFCRMPEINQNDIRHSHRAGF